jgi:hypothetical protein
MKTITLIFAVGLLAAQTVQAQGTVTYLSNVGQASAGGVAAGSDSWWAEDFATGNNPGGYVLNSVQLGMTDASGSPNGFMVMIYQNVSGSGNPSPGTDNIGTLIGSLNPATSGTYTYAAPPNLILLPHEEFYIVMTGGTTIASGAYEWSGTGAGSFASYNPIGGWNAVEAWTSSNGSSWNGQGSGPTDLQFSITATAVPEPSSSLLLLLGTGILFYVRRRK